MRVLLTKNSKFLIDRKYSSLAHWKHIKIYNRPKGSDAGNARQENFKDCNSYNARIKYLHRKIYEGTENFNVVYQFRLKGIEL